MKGQPAKKEEERERLSVPAKKADEEVNIRTSDDA